VVLWWRHSGSLRYDEIMHDSYVMMKALLIPKISNAPWFFFFFLTAPKAPANSEDAILKNKDLSWRMVLLKFFERKIILVYASCSPYHTAVCPSIHTATLPSIRISLPHHIMHANSLPLLYKVSP